MKKIALLTRDCAGVNATIRSIVRTANKYNIEVLAENYKRGEEVFQKISEKVVANIIDSGGQGSFRRDK